MSDGHMELLSIDLGHSESDRSWVKLVGDLKARGLKDPILTCSDGNAGVINAIKANFKTGYRQRFLKHRTENILDAVPKEDQEAVAELLKRIFYGATSLEQAKGHIKQFKRENKLERVNLEIRRRLNVIGRNGVKLQFIQPGKPS